MQIIGVSGRSLSMRQRHSIIRLDRARAPQAFPLVNSLNADLTLEAWLDYVEAMNSGGDAETGIMAAVDDQGYLHGLFAYRVEPDLTDGRVLDIENFVAADVAGRDDAGRDLVEVINKLAEDKQCGAISVSLSQKRAAILVNPSPIYGRFSRDGLAADAVRLKKVIGQT